MHMTYSYERTYTYYVYVFHSTFVSFRMGAVFSILLTFVDAKNNKKNFYLF